MKKILCFSALAFGMFAQCSLGAKMERELADRFDTSAGEQLFKNNCAFCHDGGSPKAPNTVFVELMPQVSIFAAMDSGIMMQQARHLSKDQKIQIVEYLTQKPFGVEEDRLNGLSCDKSIQLNLDKKPAPVGWGRDNNRFIPEEVGGITRQNVASLELRWAFRYPGATRARSQPTVGYGGIFVGSHDGTVYAFDLEAGCIHWTYKARFEVRSGIVLSGESETSAEIPKLFFGDLMGHVYAVNALTGELIWSRKAHTHPNATITGTPSFHKGILYVPVSSLEVAAAAEPSYACCTFRGKVLALDASNGEVIWETFTIQKQETVGKTVAGTPIIAPSGAPVWNSPTIDSKRGLIYFGTGQNYSSPADGNSDAIFALDLATGNKVWQYQLLAADAWNSACFFDDHPSCPSEDGPDLDLSASILLIQGKNGKDILVAGQKSGVVYGFDPDQHSQPLWSKRVGGGGLLYGGIHFGMAADGTQIYVPLADYDDQRSITSDAGRAPNEFPPQPGILALDGQTGETLWRYVDKNRCGEGRSFCKPGISAAITAIPGAVIAGHMDGHIRVYEKETGKILWEYNTARPFDSISGKGFGGGMSGPGAAISDGYMIINSGYGWNQLAPGNMLLVFAAEKL